jgi:uncharacterized protein (DUF1330 family)
MLVGLKVSNEDGYAEYRKAMRPLLLAAGGDFGCDFRVSEVLRAPGEADMNRVFTIHFPSDSARDAFFSDPAYLAIKERHFQGAVETTTILASYTSEG